MGHDYIEELIELLASRHRDGLRILSGESPPPSKFELREILLHHRSQGGKTDPEIRTPGKNAAPQAMEVESVEEYFRALDQIGGWEPIILAAREVAEDCGTMWKAFCLYISDIERPGWTPRAESTSAMIVLSHKVGVDAKTIRRYRKSVPSWIAARARRPQRFLF
ncbi:MAG TPA: hypothetical protein PK364_14150 [Synergistaceae bacterium]|nr:hypothetical protein [Synergistaceae bacterium]HPJ26965.1 hypothetical protein [Synergistaceae bacterium]HPQ38497.1 hypothetical protein [Synergistaceae bacterium]